MSKKLIVFFISTTLILISCGNVQVDPGETDDDFIESNLDQENYYHDRDTNNYCDPNPCLEVEWSDGNCVEIENGFKNHAEVDWNIVGAVGNRNKQFGE